MKDCLDSEIQMYTNSKWNAQLVWRKGDNRGDMCIKDKMGDWTSPIQYVHDYTFNVTFKANH